MSTKVLKVVGFGDSGETAEWGSKQLPEDPFAGQYIGQQGDVFVAPPFSLEQLVFLAETHPTHGSAISQKTADTVGGGWFWTDPTGLQEKGKPVLELDEKFKALAGEGTMLETLTAAWLDWETVGQGYIEIARDANGKVRNLYHVPAHTCRTAPDGKRIAQIRNGRTVWFKRWGLKNPDGTPNKTELTIDGQWVRDPASNKKQRANELLVFRSHSRRSSYYGIPEWVSSIGWVALALAARDYNILFFKNKREPRWLIMLTNLEDDGGDLMEDLKQAFTVDLADPHRNLVVPIEGEGKIEVKKMSEEMTEGSFERLILRCDNEILVAHRVPPDRVAIGGTMSRGPLGGSAAATTNRIYKEGVIAPRQAMLADRFNAFLHAEFGEFKDHFIKFHEVDLSERQQCVDEAVNLFKNLIMRLDEARQHVGLKPLGGEDGKKFFTDLAAGSGAGAAPGAAMPGEGANGASVMGPAGATEGRPAEPDTSAVEDIFGKRMAVVEEQIAYVINKMADEEDGLL